jgi:uncharacterized protein YprB with RNaseH-like and TPR domain
LKNLDQRIKQRIEDLRLALLERSPGPRFSWRRPQPVPLEAIEDAREVTGEGGECLVIEKEVDHYVDGQALTKAARTLLGKADTAPAFIFLDLETTGLSATPLFLAGTMFEDKGRLKTMQLLARDYAEERSVIGILDDVLSGFDCCITFNGKSFDLPYMRERAKYHKTKLRASPEQFDLLHHARRAWKHCLPNCRLITLEWYILGRRRVGDIPGWEVPCIYHDFVHTKDARKLVDVLRHNLMDILSMAELLISISEAAGC